MPKGNTPTRMGQGPRELTTDEKKLQERLGDQYELLERIGAGGMGTVYKAHDRGRDALVAVKIVRDTAGDDLIALRRLQTEAQALASLDHPNIVRVMRLVTLEANQLALVMEFAEGKDLAGIIEHEQKLNAPRARRLFIQCVKALAVAHDAGIIHRDLKPSNILITKQDGEEQVKILDFGLAKLSESGSQKLTRTGTVMGSPAYMSPEQCSASQNLDGRSDIYSLGCVFYEALVGKPPFSGDSSFEVLMKHSNDRVPLIQSGDHGLSLIIAKCTERDPADRFQSAHALLDALVNNGFSYKPTDRVTVKPRRTRIREKMVIGAIVAVCIFGIAFGGYKLYESQTPHQQNPEDIAQQKRGQAALLAKRLHVLKVDHLQASPELLQQVHELDKYIVEANNLTDLVDLGNAYNYFGKTEWAVPLWQRAIQLNYENNISPKNEVPRVAVWMMGHDQQAEARRILDTQLSFELKQGDVAAIAKARLDLLAFAAITADKKLRQEMYGPVREAARDAETAAYFETMLSTRSDWFLNTAQERDPKFLDSILKGTTK